MPALTVAVPLARFSIQTDIECPNLKIAFLSPSSRCAPNHSNQIDLAGPVFYDGDQRQNLSESITRLSGIDESDFLKHTTMVFPFESEWFRLQGATRNEDEALLETIVEHADHLLDGIRINYCRLDVPQMCFGPAAYVPEKNMNAAWVFETDSNNGRLIAREPQMPIVMPGIGLDFDSIDTSFVDPLILSKFAPNSLGARLKRLLRVYASVLCSPTVESKLLTLVFSLDGILTPENSTSSQFKKYVAVSATHDPNSFQMEYDRFREFYADVRNPLVHCGKAHHDLGRDLSADLQYLQCLTAKLLRTLTPCANVPFDQHWCQQMKTATNLK